MLLNGRNLPSRPLLYDEQWEALNRRSSSEWYLSDCILYCANKCTSIAHAKCAQSQERHCEALPLLERALEIQKQELGQDNTKTILTESTLTKARKAEVCEG